MNVYDLDRQATPAPWVVLSGSNQKEIGTLGEGTVLVSKHHPPWEDCEPRCIANSALAAHCRNNFMKLLNALKAAHDLHRGYTGGPCYSGCKTCILIKELEEVKL